MKLNKQLPYLFLTLLILGFSACKKENDNTFGHDVVTNLQDTAYVGKTVALTPKLADKANTTFTWEINGQPAGTDTVLNFKPAAKGDYKIAFKAVNKKKVSTGVYNIYVKDKFVGGFYIVNEGWFGHGTGLVNFYRYETKTIEDSIFTKENPGKTLDPATSTLQSGVIFNKKFFLISKVGGPVVVTDEYTMAELARIPAKGGNDWRSFVGVDANKGFLSARNGLYLINPTTLELGAQVDGISGQVGDLMKVGNYIFALSQSKGVVIINATTNAIEKTITGAVVGFAKTTDGSVWAGGGTTLFKINSTDLTVENITVPFTIYGSWGAWHPGSITASTRENAVFLAKNGTFSGGREIYKYIPGNAATLTQPFITLPTGKSLYGSGVAYDPAKNKVILTTVLTGFGESFKTNNMYFHDATSAALSDTYTYTGYYFPSIIVFHQ